MTIEDAGVPIEILIPSSSSHSMNNNLLFQKSTSSMESSSSSGCSFAPRRPLPSGGGSLTRSDSCIISVEQSTDPGHRRRGSLTFSAVSRLRRAGSSRTLGTAMNADNCGSSRNGGASTTDSRDCEPRMPPRSLQRTSPR
uniref:Uncharacterized protein n=1 Tax=Craspedostauros australis TaxID=1486917 RepID=A0A7R9WVY1_9STRA